MLDQVGGPIDVEIAKMLKQNYEKKGISYSKWAAKSRRLKAESVLYEEKGQEQK